MHESIPFATAELWHDVGSGRTLRRKHQCIGLDRKRCLVIELNQGRV